ncbi:MAG: hypothetical protein K2J01_06360, partial [Clostridiales bacterium]|nr:hypothetical protein [Clostridiales bacterium]
MKNKSTKPQKDIDKASKKAEAERLRRARKAETERLRRAQKAASVDAKRQVSAKKEAVKRERQRTKEAVRQEKAKIAVERQKKRAAVYAKFRVKLKNNKAGFEYKSFGLIPRVELAVKGDKTSVVTRLAAAGVKVTDIRFSDGVSL